MDPKNACCHDMRRDVLELFLGESSPNPATSVRIEHERVRILITLLRHFRDEELSDWTVVQVLERKIGHFPIFGAASIALETGSTACLGSLVPLLAANGSRQFAIDVARKAGREPCADEVRALGAACLAGKYSRDQEERAKLEALYRSHVLQSEWEELASRVAEQDKLEADGI